MERPERAALVEPEAGVDNHGDPEGGEEDEEGQVAAPAVVPDNAQAGRAPAPARVVGVVSPGASGGRGVAADDGAQRAAHSSSDERAVETRRVDGFGGNGGGR